MKKGRWRKEDGGRLDKKKIIKGGGVFEEKQLAEFGWSSISSSEETHLRVRES